VFTLDELGRITLTAQGDQRPVLTDSGAGMFAAVTGDAHAVARLPGESFANTLLIEADRYLNSPETSLYKKGGLLLGLHEGRSALTAGATPVIVDPAITQVLPADTASQALRLATRLGFPVTDVIIEVANGVTRQAAKAPVRKQSAATLAAGSFPAGPANLPGEGTPMKAQGASYKTYANAFPALRQTGCSGTLASGGARVYRSS
jgi:hypothetical protein